MHSMDLAFTKMQGLGNDFVVIDATQKPFDLESTVIKQMADRRYGVGFDQLLVIEPGDKGNSDFSYRIFNSDSSEAEQCGNGLRCIARYLFDRKLTKKNILTLSCKAGLMEAEPEAYNMVKVNMGVPVFAPEKIPFSVSNEQLIYGLVLDDVEIRLGVISMGNPHAVICVDDLNTVDIQQVGRAVSTHKLLPQGANVSFMQVSQPYQAHLEVFERGVGPTPACGSAACAAMVYGNKLGILDREVNIIQPGGELLIQWNGGNSPVYVTGPAETTFEGKWSFK